MSSDGISLPEQTGVAETRELIEGLLEVLRASECARGDISEALRHLSQNLGERFHREESGGFHEEVLMRAPWLAASVGQLKQQHVVLLRIMDGMECAVRSRSTVAWRTRDLRRRLKELEKLFCEHELLEMHVLQDSCQEPAWTSE